jgi:hypothetical protein
MLNADRLEHWGRRLAASYLLGLGVLACVEGGLIWGGVILILGGIAQVEDAVGLMPMLIVYLAGVASFLLLIGMALALQRGDRMLRALLPALVAGLYGLLLAREPIFGLFGVNATTLALIFILGFLCLVVVANGSSGSADPEKRDQ